MSDSFNGSEVNVFPINSWDDPSCQILLHPVHRRYERCELVCGITCMCSGDITTVPTTTRPGVQQQTVGLAGPSLQNLVVQYRCRFVDRDNSVIRQFLLALPAGRYERLMDLVLGRTRVKGIGRSHMPPRAPFIGGTQTSDFIVGFTATSKFEALPKISRAGSHVTR